MSAINLFVRGYGDPVPIGSVGSFTDAQKVAADIKARGLAGFGQLGAATVGWELVGASGGLVVTLTEVTK